MNSSCSAHRFARVTSCCAKLDTGDDDDDDDDGDDDGKRYKVKRCR